MLRSGLAAHHPCNRSGGEGKEGKARRVKASLYFLAPYTARGCGEREDEGLKMFRGLAYYLVPISLPLSLPLLFPPNDDQITFTFNRCSNQITFTFNRCSNQACGAARVLTKSNLTSSEPGIA
jgi:hypothetical protein